MVAWARDFEGTCLEGVIEPAIARVGVATYMHEMAAQRSKVTQCNFQL